MLSNHVCTGMYKYRLQPWYPCEGTCNHVYICSSGPFHSDPSCPSSCLSVTPYSPSEKASTHHPLLAPPQYPCPMFGGPVRVGDELSGPGHLDAELRKGQRALPAGQFGWATSRLYEPPTPGLQLPSNPGSPTWRLRPSSVGGVYRLLWICRRWSCFSAESLIRGLDRCSFLPAA